MGIIHIIIYNVHPRNIRASPYSMTIITNDPGTLKDYEEELAYYYDTHPVEVPEPSAIRNFLTKAAKASASLDIKVREAASSPTAKKIGSVVRDIAERSNASDGLGGDSGGGFDFHNMGGGFFESDNQSRQPQREQSRKPGTQRKGSSGRKTIIKQDGTIIMVHDESNRKRKKNRDSLDDDGPGFRFGGDHL